MAILFSNTMEYVTIQILSIILNAFHISTGKHHYKGVTNICSQIVKPQYYQTYHKDL